MSINGSGEGDTDRLGMGESAAVKFCSESIGFGAKDQEWFLLHPNMWELNLHIEIFLPQGL
ncbi:hypothetical protein [Pseudomonas sp. FW306-02-H05-AB]|uniref:hypothetical protein n=1 Tax=Pseudomonas sp. FW306-02-H05-AB TaxID=2070666 RepID=UPI0011AF159B|nr:hypothetical protein [Pseudomonas sp. FW306-02-H05-AB]